MTWSPLACGIVSGKYDSGIPPYSRASLKVKERPEWEGTRDVRPLGRPLGAGRVEPPRPTAVPTTVPTPGWAPRLKNGDGAPRADSMAGELPTAGDRPRVRRPLSLPWPNVHHPGIPRPMTLHSAVTETSGATLR